MPPDGPDDEPRTGDAEPGPKEGALSTEAVDGEEVPSGLDSAPSCPRCDEPISGQERTCPGCGLDFLDEEGGLTQDAVDAMLDDAGISRSELGPRTEFYAPRTARLVIGLAICVPMAPLGVFVVESAAPVPLWASGIVFVASWLVPGWFLSRIRVPSLIVAIGLMLIGLTMALTPLAIVGGRALFGTDASDIGALGSNVMAAQSVFLVVGLVVVGLGAIVYRHATAKRDRWGPSEREK